MLSMYEREMRFINKGSVAIPTKIFLPIQKTIKPSSKNLEILC